MKANRFLVSGIGRPGRLGRLRPRLRGYRHELGPKAEPYCRGHASHRRLLITTQGESSNDVSLIVDETVETSITLQVRISKYIPAASGELDDMGRKKSTSVPKNGSQTNNSMRKSLKTSNPYLKPTDAAIPRLEPFSPGQVFNATRFKQINVLANASKKEKTEFQSLNTRALMANAGPISLP